MNLKSIFYTVSILLTQLHGYCQSGKEIETDFLTMRKSIVGIGTVVNDTVLSNGVKIPIRKFVTIGSGLMTYAKYDTVVINNVVTAGHVIKYFIENKLKSIFLKPSWADTIKTTDYFGVEIPIGNPNNTPNIFLYPDSKIDLGCVLMLPRYYNELFIKHVTQENNQMFGYSNMTVPYLGDQIWVGGYPDHIESQIETRFFYSIAILKPGYIVWKPSSNMTDSNLNHITLIESNATFGNSGGPVFSMHEKIELVGILVGGYEDINSIYLNNKLVYDPITKQALVANTRSGVSIIEKAEFVKKLIEYAQNQVNRYRK